MRKLSFLPSAKERDSGSLLPWVIAVMVYLTALALFGGLGLQDAVGRWTSEITHSLTIQVVNADDSTRGKEARAVVTRLNATPGVIKAEIMGQSEIQRLLEPWLGQGNVSADLPIPALINVVFDPEATPDLAALSASLAKVAPDARMDDHQQWIGQLMALAGIIEIIAAVIVCLIILATIAIVMFGAKAGMASHHETIETLHIMGARDNTIAGAFQRRFMFYGFKGGLIGLVVAAATVAALMNVMGKLGDSIMLPLAFTPPELVTLAALPIFAGLLAMLTARFTVMNALSKLV
jgi:cell division transport system permease protein